MNNIKRHIVTIIVLFACFFSIEAKTDTDKEKIPENEDEKIYNEVKELLYNLLYGDEQTKINAGNRLGQIRASYSVRGLEKALLDPSLKVKETVINALGKIPTPASTTALKTFAKKEDEEVSLRIFAVERLAEMFIDSSYKACLEVLETSKNSLVKKAALSCLKAWNKPHSSLPEPLPLPAGKKEPEIVEKQKSSEELKPILEKEKKGIKDTKKKKQEQQEKQTQAEKIEELKTPSVFMPKPPKIEKWGIITEFPQEEKSTEQKQEAVLDVPREEAYVTFDVLRNQVISCLKSHGIQPDRIKVKVIINASGKVKETLLPADIDESISKCIKDIFAETDFPPFITDYDVEHEYILKKTPRATLKNNLIFEEKDVFPETERKAKPTENQLYTLELSHIGDKKEAWVDFSIPHSIGGLIFTASGEYIFKKILGVSIEVSAGSGIYQDEYAEEKNEKPVMGNLGLGLRLLKTKMYKKAEFNYSLRLLTYFPTASKGNYLLRNVYNEGGADKNLLASVYISQIDYYHIERAFPDINESIPFSLRPDFGFSLQIQKIKLQTEFGFDFIMMRDFTYKSEYEDEKIIEVPNIIMTHLGAGFYILPVNILQIAIEATYIKEINGELFSNPENPSSSLRSPEGELFITPSFTIKVNTGSGEAVAGIGIRLPAGEIASQIANFILVTRCGFFW